MAWTSKPSSTIEIERRAEPYLTESMREAITREILPRYEQARGALLAALHMVQDEHGWLPAQALEEIAEFLELAPGDVLDTASFYEEYWLKPKGRHVIGVCRSIACEFCDHQVVTDACREKLGIELGQTSKDGEFTLVELECLGSCGTAPVALVDHTLHENLTPDKMRRVIDETKDKKGH
ncbi:MAG: NADH-quinone oxidoreductase subunit NuoE [Planctomycetota bacterium]|jgi:NADH-quinone oxidoreductase subunit E